MPNVKLRANIIILDTGGKVLLKEGEIVDVQKIPPRLRKRRYMIREGERDLKEEERTQQIAYAEGQINDVETILEEEPRNPTRSSRRG